MLSYSVDADVDFVAQHNKIDWLVRSALVRFRSPCLICIAISSDNDDPNVRPYAASPQSAPGRAGAHLAPMALRGNACGWSRSGGETLGLK